VLALLHTFDDGGRVTGVFATPSVVQVQLMFAEPSA
jgi:hypothetical protein